MPSTTQLVVTEESKRGTLARVASLLGKAGVNIKAFCAPAVEGHGELRLIVSDLDKARQALKGEKITFREETALVLSLHNEPGALSDVAAHLHEAGINIDCAYLTPSREGKRAIVVLTVSDVQKALATLQDRSLDEI